MGEETEKERRARLLRRAFAQSLNTLDRIGTSKRADRGMATKAMRKLAIAKGMSRLEAKKLHAPPNFIHSKKTLAGYKSTCGNFANWLAENHPDVNKIAYAHRMGYDAEWIATFDNADTQQTYRSALAKAFRIPGEDISDTNKRGQPTKGHNFDPKTDFPAALEKYGPVVWLGRITGARREELPNITPECFQRDEFGNLWCIYDGHVQNTKCARDRSARILQDNIPRLEEMLSHSTPGVPLYPRKLPSHFNEHALRRLYAADVYHHYERPIEQLKGQRVNTKPKRDNQRGTVRTDSPAAYYNRAKKRYYDLGAINHVSHYLGHGDERASMVVTNYGDYF